MPAKVVIVHGNVKPDGRTQRRLPSIQAPTPNRTSSTHVNPRQPGRVPALKLHVYAGDAMNCALQPAGE
ncbi:hypothetical protein ACCO45_004025 [Purpureocillium lilacinum]|uniref:Uncharacterized protein n=1 Tax=Purpureocillium lilacinum TaxID=33203 RepID=A0ACC4E2I9_PURLI